MSRNKILINPETLRWARNKAHLSEERAAKSAGVSNEKYKLFESGEASPTLRQLYLFSKKFNRPSQFFFLKEIPDELEILPEMRRLPGSIVGEESPELVAQVNMAIERREIALRLLRELGEKPTNINIRVSTNQDPEMIGILIREKLGVSINDQASWKEKYKAMRGWRSAVENLGVLVFHMPRISSDEMRGLSISLRPLPIIGINSKDFVRPRIFTLFHELVHILIGEMVLDSPKKPWFQIDKDLETEHFCNQVAAEILVPQSDLLHQIKSINKHPNSNWEDYEVFKLSSRYQVSRAVIIRCLKKSGYISRLSYEYLREKYDSYTYDRVHDGGGNHYYNTISWLGTFIPQLAFRGYYEDRVTASDLSALFNLQVKNLGKMEEKVFSSSSEVAGE